MSDKDTKKKRGSYNKNNEYALKHGAARAVKAIRHNKPLVGKAAEIQAEWEGKPYLEALRIHAARQSAVSQLYWDGVKTALQNEDTAGLLTCLKGVGWANLGAARCWKLVADEERRAGKDVPDYYSEVERIRQGDKNDDN